LFNDFGKEKYKHLFMITKILVFSCNGHRRYVFGKCWFCL